MPDSDVSTIDPEVAEILAERALTDAKGQQREVLARGNVAGTPYALIDNDQQGRARVEVWHVEDREPRMILRTHLGKVLGKMRNGKYIFWAKGMPGEQPMPRQKTALMCLLHPDHPDREWFDSIGLAGRFCNSADTGQINRADLPDEINRRLHMERRHRVENQVVQEAKRERDRQEEHTYQREDRESARAVRELLATAATTVTKKPKG
jgi:hypothetical protein